MILSIVYHGYVANTPLLRYPQHLAQYDSYELGVLRADFIRYCILETYGGIYADFDVENLQNMDDVLDQHQVIFGEEPYEHTILLFPFLSFLITNCLMMSVPNHPLWAVVFERMVARYDKRDACSATGPFMLSDAYERFNATAQIAQYPIYIAPPIVFFPGWDTTNENVELICTGKTDKPLSEKQVIVCKDLVAKQFVVPPRGKESYSAHRWIHTYYGTVDRDWTQPITELVPNHMFWRPSNSVQAQYMLPVGAAIPRIIHQIWTNASIPIRMDPYVRSWVHTYHSLGYKHKLWTTAECRGLVEKKYPNYLNMYDSYPSDLHRAHAAKYFILHAHGGIVADLDVQAVGSMDALLTEFKLILGGEPLEHAHIVHDADFLLGNSIMASIAAHPFWDHVFSLLESSAAEPTVYASVGPLVLNQAYLTLGHHADMYIAQPQIFYPTHDVDHPTLREVCQEGKSPSERQKSMCKVLGDHGYHQGEASEKSMTVCHWVFGFDDIADDLVDISECVPGDMRDSM